MGKTLTNYHLDTAGFEKEQVIDKFIALYRIEGYGVCNDEADIDRVLCLLYKPGARWLAICEKGVEALPIKDLKKTASKFARHFGTNAVASMVYDSDVLAMHLESASQQKKDLVVLDPGCAYSDELGYNPKTSKGKADIWGAALDCGTDALKALWEEDRVFAEEKLTDIGKLLGFGDTAEFYAFDEWEESDCPAGYEFITLSFRSLTKSGPAYEIVHEGPAAIGMDRRELYIIWNERKSFSFLNRGGPHIGAYFYLESPLWADHDFDFSEVTLERQKVFTGNKYAHYPEDFIIHKATFQKEKTQEDDKWLMIAYFPDFPIPEGVKVNYATQSTWKKIMDVSFAHSMIVRFTLNGDDTVRGNVRAFLLPLEDGTGNITHYGHGTELISRSEHDKQIDEHMRQHGQTR